ncbi:MAG TPA: hypothetical protein VGR78_01305, partial [Verrucomicrobiae bacterium]|nr:hypothetical protein [Verrucomicrobiae bacterium]
PGGGSREYRRQLKALHDFIYSFDFIHLKPAAEVVKAGVPSGFHAFTLAKPGAAYGIYIGPSNARQPAAAPERNEKLRLALPDGTYIAQWLDPSTGETGQKAEVRSEGGIALLDFPAFHEDVALAVQKK